MSKFIKNIRLEIDYEDDKVVVTVSPLKVADMLKLKADKRGYEDLKNMQESEIREIMGLLKSYFISVEGLRDANGDAVTKEDVFENVYFMGLLTDVIEQWLARSMPPPEKSGNSEPSVK